MVEAAGTVPEPVTLSLQQPTRCASRPNTHARTATLYVGLLLLCLTSTGAAVHGSLRFNIGDRVECHLPGGMWEAGTIEQLNVEQDGATQPYLVRLDSGGMVVAPGDDNRFIRAEGQSTSVSARLLRFRVGSRVECNLGMYWERGTVTDVNFHSPNFGEGVTVPYQIDLDSGGSVFAPKDDESVIRREGTLQMADPNLRFRVGQRVLCAYDDDGTGERRWEAGRVVALHYHEARFGEGNTMPYQVKLDHEERLIFIPRDEVSLIRAEAAPTIAGSGALAPTAAASSGMAARVSPPAPPSSVATNVAGGGDDSARSPRSLPGSTVPPQKPAARGGVSGRASKIGQGKVGRRASTIGVRNQDSKLGSSKLGKRPERARSHQSALPETRGDALRRWREVTEFGATE